MSRSWKKLRDPETGQITARVQRDYRALIPLLRHRYEPDNPAGEGDSQPAARHAHVDRRALQMRASEILSKRLVRLGKQKGAVVMMDPATGDMLAAVSYPWPIAGAIASLKTAPRRRFPETICSIARVSDCIRRDLRSRS